MIKDVVMPKAGLTMVEGTIVEWTAAEGAQVKKGDALMEYENEKSVQTCTALSAGILHICAKAGDTVAIGEKIAVLADTKEEYDALVSGVSVPSAEAPEKDRARECSECVAAPAPEAPEAPQPGGHVRASGLARKMATDAGISLASVPSTDGRIRAKDVKAYLNSLAAAPAAAPVTVPAEPAPIPAAVPEPCGDEIAEIPWTGVRKTIAANMFRSVQTTAQCTAFREVDVTDFLALRDRLAAAEETLGFRVSVNDLLCRMMARIVKKHPIANATFDGKTLYRHEHVHLTVAVATEGGLMVPVVRNIDTLSLREIHQQIKALAEQAKDRALPPGSQAGGTCTISNYGVFPIDFSTPVLNAPQTCIAGFGRPALKPAVLPDGTIGARQLMLVAFTFDHQVFDGLTVGRVLGDIEKYLKEPELILV